MKTSGQVFSLLDSAKNYLPVVTFTESGTLVRGGHQVVYLEGFGSKEISSIIKSFLGGVVSTASAIGVSNLLLMELKDPVYYGLSGYYILSNLLTVSNVGSWYIMPFLLKTIGYNPLLSYGLAAVLKSSYLIGDLQTQHASPYQTQFINTDLSGHVANHFSVKAIFTDTTPKQAVYQFNRMPVDVPEGKNDSYSKLASILRQMNVKQIAIHPIEDNGHNRLTTFFLDPALKTHIEIKIDGDFGSHYESPWLLQTLFQKKDRLGLTSVHSALSPEIIDAIAVSYEAYFTNNRSRRNNDENSPQGALLERIAPNLFQYSIPDQQLGLAQSIRRELNYSLFRFEGVNEPAITLNWSDAGTSWSWPSLGMKQQDRSNPGPTQWLLPEWAGQLLAAELSFYSRRLGNYLAKENFSMKGYGNLSNSNEQTGAQEGDNTPDGDGNNTPDGDGNNTPDGAWSKELWKWSLKIGR